MHGVLLLAARALEEARAMHREYGDVLAQLRDREQAQTLARQGQREARVERIAAVRGEAARHRSRIARLRSLAQTLDVPDRTQAIPAAPASDDDDAWGDYVRRLAAGVRELEAAIGETAHAQGERLRAALAATAATPTVDDVLSAYVAQRHMKSGLDPAQAERFRQTAARVLARLEHPPGAALPANLEALAKEIVLAPTVERAEALATQLRLAVQDAREAQAAQQAEAADAKRLLETLPEDAPAPLLRALEHVAAGVARLDASLRKAAQSVLDESAADREHAEQAAAALVLQESLRDLGYEVEDIEATLFVDGGTVHFRRAGWESYFVRMRLDAQAHSLNFNVVRARGDEETAERRRQDTLAEDRWCAEFPKLLQTLAARGLVLDVTRRLDAGAVPVQVVDAAGLPKIAAEDDAGPRATPLARKLT